MGILGWLGQTYQELGDEQKALDCFTQQKRHIHLQKTYAKILHEKSDTKKKQRNEDFHYFLIIAGIFFLVLCAGILTSYFLIKFVPFINFLIFPSYFIMYLYFLRKIRGLFTVREEYQNEIFLFTKVKPRVRKWSPSRQKLLENIIKFVIFYPTLFYVITFMTMPWINISFSDLQDLGYHITVHSLSILINYVWLLAIFNIIRLNKAFQRIRS